MQTNSSWIEARFLQFLQALMPMPCSARASAPIRRDTGVRRNPVHPSMRLLQDVLEAGQRVPRESSLAGSCGTPIRVLIAVDDPQLRDGYARVLRETGVSSDIAAFRERLGKSGSHASRWTTRFEPICCGRTEEAVAEVHNASAHQRPFAVVFIDVSASSCDGVRTAIRVRQMDPEAEIVLCTGCTEIDRFEIAGILAPEEKLSYLPASAKSAEVGQMIIALGSKWLAERRIARLAYLDSLTQLPNREQFHNRLAHALETAQREKQLLGLLYLDLDRFKSVNDTLGHSAGDQLLRAVAGRLRNNLRYERHGGFQQAAGPRTGDLARLGGDEFVAMLPGLRTVSDAALVAGRLIAAIRKPVWLAGKPVVVTSSVGIAIYPHDGANTESLLRSADASMYFAKRRRPGTYAFFAAMNAAAIVPFPAAARAR